MSLFENASYEWRETYFVFCNADQPPPADEISELVAGLGNGYRASDVRVDENGRFEAVTVYCEADSAAMDITYLGGDDVASTMQELPEELDNKQRPDEEKQQIRRILMSDARYDVYHFEQTAGNEDAGDMPLDPGALLMIINRIVEKYNGVAIDPQSGELL